MKLVAAAASLLMAMSLASAGAAPYPQPVLLDNTGKFIGAVFYFGSIVVNIGGQSVLVPFSPQGITKQNQPNYYFAQKKCVGAKYVTSATLPVTGTVVGANLIYAGVDAKQLTYKSYNYFDSVQNKAVCVDSTTTTTIVVATPKTVTLASLGLTGLKAPFVVKLK